MKYIIWGAGKVGQRLHKVLKLFNVVAFVDGDKNKQGNYIEDTPIISLEEYLQKYQDCIMVLAVSSHLYIQSMEKILKDNNVVSYVDIYNLPSELYYPDNIDISFFSSIFELYNVKDYNTKIIIYGTGLFGFLLYEYLSRRNNDICFIEEDNCYQLSKWMEKTYGVRYIKKSETTSDDKILSVKKKFCTSSEKNIIPFYKFENLKRYERNDLRKYKDIHHGKRCFIIGNGPSLHMEDLDILWSNHEICFGVNNIWVGFRNTKWRPTYYVAADPTMFESYSHILTEFKESECFFSDVSPNFLKTNVLSSNMNVYHAIHQNYMQEPPDFSEDITKAVFGCGSVIYDCLQIAYYMGFTQIYLIGMDCGNSDGSGWKIKHFVDDYERFGEDKSETYYLDVDRMFKAFYVAKNIAEKNNIEVYNATRGGNLEIFRRVDFRSLF